MTQDHDHFDGVYGCFYDDKPKVKKSNFKESESDGSNWPYGIASAKKHISIKKPKSLSGEESKSTFGFDYPYGF